MSTSAIAAANGETRRAPSASRTRVVFSITSRPPIPEAIRTPMSVDSAAMSRPECCTASRAAAMANCTCGVLRRASLLPKIAAASNPLTSPAIRTGRRDASKCVIGAVPLRPALSASQLSVTLLPTGETVPMPVTTTRRGVGSAMVASRPRVPGSGAADLTQCGPADAGCRGLGKRVLDPDEARDHESRQLAAEMDVQCRWRQ